MQQARAFLFNGVFTLVAPLSRVMDTSSSTNNSKMRTIVVTDGDAVPSMASLELNDDEDSKPKAKETNETEDAMVETVEEEDGKDWEEVNKDTATVEPASKAD